MGPLTRWEAFEIEAMACADAARLSGVESAGTIESVYVAGYVFAMTLLRESPRHSAHLWEDAGRELGPEGLAELTELVRQHILSVRGDA